MEDDGQSLFHLVLKSRDIGAWVENPESCMPGSLRLYLDPEGPHQSSAEPCVDLFMLPLDERPSAARVAALHEYARGLAPKQIRNAAVGSGRPVFERRRSLTVGRDYHYVDLDNQRDRAAEEMFSWALPLGRKVFECGGCGPWDELGCMINDYTTDDYISDHADSDIGLVPDSPIGCYTDYCYESEDTPRAEAGTNCRVIVFSRKLGDSKKDAGILVLATVPGLVYIMHNTQRGYKHGSPVPGNGSLSAPCAKGVNRVSVTVRAFVPLVKELDGEGSDRNKRLRTEVAE
jgi:hypothetical protein